MRILYVIDTHIHADHISAGRALAEAAGADYVLFEGAQAAFPFRAVKDGDVLELGNVTATVMHTPGHTPEHISLLVTDRTRAPEPWFVLTGHTLMVGDVGRTELASSAEDGARALFASVAAAETTARSYRGAARGLFRLGLRTVAERQADVDDRLREALQQGVPHRRRGRVRSGDDRRHSTAAARMQPDNRAANAGAAQ